MVLTIDIEFSKNPSERRKFLKSCHGEKEFLGGSAVKLFNTSFAIQ